MPTMRNKRAILSAPAPAPVLSRARGSTRGSIQKKETYIFGSVLGYKRIFRNHQKLAASPESGAEHGVIPSSLRTGVREPAIGDRRFCKCECRKTGASLGFRALSLSVSFLIQGASSAQSTEHHDG